MDPVANTSLGRYRGSLAEGVACFRGIAYAQPPVGPRRFMSPAELDEPFGTRDARADGPVPPQTPSRLGRVMGDFSRPIGEDCLTLTIWAPEKADHLPVLVFIHGGAWMSGAGSLDWYDGGTLARDGALVVVAVNHRLGALGYLCHPAVAPGDLGTQDVAAALRWIGREIEAFGGGPRCVTLMGQSAGASTIGALIADPATRPMFSRAILQSGGFGRTPVSPAEGAARATSLARHLGFDLAAADGPARLRAVPVADMLAAQGAVAREIAAFGDTVPPFPPVVAGDRDVAHRLRRIAAAAVGLDLLVGTTRDEAHAFFAGDNRLDAATPVQVGAPAAALTGKPDGLAAYRSARPGASWGEALADLTTEAVYRRPALQLAADAAAAGARVFAYRFDWAPPASPFETCHCIDLPFVFGTFAAFGDAPMLAGGDPAEMAALSRLMRSNWAAFVRCGDPGIGDLRHWAPYSSTASTVMRFGHKVGPMSEIEGAFV